MSNAGPPSTPSMSVVGEGEFVQRWEQMWSRPVVSSYSWLSLSLLLQEEKEEKETVFLSGNPDSVANDTETHVGVTQNSLKSIITS